MSVDLTELTIHIGKRKNLRSVLFVKGLFDKNDLSPDHKKAKTHKCLNCDGTWFRKISDSSMYVFEILVGIKTGIQTICFG